MHPKIPWYSVLHWIYDIRDCQFRIDHHINRGHILKHTCTVFHAQRIATGHWQTSRMTRRTWANKMVITKKLSWEHWIRIISALWELFFTDNQKQNWILSSQKISRMILTYFINKMMQLNNHSTWSRRSHTNILESMLPEFLQIEKCSSWDISFHILHYSRVRHLRKLRPHRCQAP